ncbi:Cyanovirin-N [Trichoderma sp. SZMC 28014]
MKLSSTFLSIILSMSTHARGQNFADLCNNITLIEPYTLQADCLEGDGTTVRTSTIDLYKCLGNINGVLKCYVNGRFGTSCTDCVLQDDTIFVCQCRNAQQKVGRTYIDLDSCINNGDGELVC